MLNRYSTWNRKMTIFSRHLHNSSTSDIGMVGYIDVSEDMELSPKEW